MISTFFPPQQAVASLRAWSFAREWAEAGESVTVLTTAKREDQGGLERPARGYTVVELAYEPARWREWIRRIEKAPSNSTSSAPASTGRTDHAGRPGLARRLARKFRQRTGIFSASRMPDITDSWVEFATEWALAQEPWDIVLSSSGPYTPHLVARALKRRGHTRAWIAEFRDLWTDNHIYRGLFPFTLIERAREQSCLREADMLVTVSDGLADSLRARTAQPVEVVYNGYDETEAARREPRDAEPHPSTFVIAYTGTVYPPAQNPRPLLDALRLLRQHEPDIYERTRLVVVGERMDEWAKLRDARGLQGAVELRGVVPREQALELQRSTDALLLLDWNAPHAGILTAKAFEYLATIAPILIVGRRKDSSLGELVGRAGRGVHLGDNAAEIAGHLRDLARDPEALRLAPDRAFIASLSRQNQAARLLTLARELVDGQPSGNCH